MDRLKLTDEIVEAAVLGGCVLGGGGGGSLEEGRRIGHFAVSLSSPELIDIIDIDKNSVLINDLLLVPFQPKIPMLNQSTVLVPNKRETYGKMSYVKR